MPGPSAPFGTGRRSVTLAFVVFLAAALLATYPLLREPSRTIAGGLGDPVIVTTLLAWDADRIAHGLSGLWDPPFLFPHRQVLAYSEHMLGVALFTAPVQWLLRSPVLVYNLAYLASYVLAGFGMFLLTRWLWNRTDAALLAGLAFELTPYRLAQSSHLQVLMNGWMPIGLLALHRYFVSGSRRWLVAFVATYLFSGLANGYYLYFFLLPVAVLLAVECAMPRLPRKRLAIDFTVAGAAIGAAMAPIALVYLQLQRANGFVRQADQLPGLSARLGDYFRTAPGAWTWGGLLSSGAGERQLFHGFVVMLFAVAGVGTIGRWIPRPDRGSWGRDVGTYGVMAALAVWLSMGPGPGRPYGLLFRVVPGLNGLRVPARLSAVVVLTLAVLAGAGFAWFMGTLSKRAALVATVAIAAVIVLEGQHGVGVSEVAGWRDKSWDHVAYEWLRASPPGGVVELDITEMDNFREFTPIYQLNALEHRHPIVNGYSGWKSSLQELLGARDSPLRDAGQVADTLRGLRRIGVRYILLHERTFEDPEAARRLVAQIHAAKGQIADEHQWPGVWGWQLNDPDRRPQASDHLARIDSKILELRASHEEPRLALVVDGDVDTRWMTGVPQAGNEWIEVRLPRPTDVGRVEIVGGSRTLLDYPRHLRIASVDAADTSQVLIDDAVIDRYLESVASNDQQPSIALDLRRNQTVRLRIEQTGRGDPWWSIHELKIWERKEER